MLPTSEAALLTGGALIFQRTGLTFAGPVKRYGHRRTCCRRRCSPCASRVRTRSRSQWPQPGTPRNRRPATSFRMPRPVLPRRTARVAGQERAEFARKGKSGKAPLWREQQGFQFVTVKELINAPGATLDIRPYCFDAKIGDTERYDDLARRLDVKFREFTARFRSGAGPARASEKKTNGKPEDDGAGFMELPERNPAFHDISEGAEVSPRSDEPWR